MCSGCLVAKVTRAQRQSRWVSFLLRIPLPNWHVPAAVDLQFFLFARQVLRRAHAPHLKIDGLGCVHQNEVGHQTLLHSERLGKPAPVAHQGIGQPALVAGIDRDEVLSGHPQGRVNHLYVGRASAVADFRLEVRRKHYAVAALVFDSTHRKTKPLREILVDCIADIHVHVRALQDNPVSKLGFGNGQNAAYQHGRLHLGVFGGWGEPLHELIGPLLPDARQHAHLGHFLVSKLGAPHLKPKVPHDLVVGSGHAKPLVVAAGTPQMDQDGKQRSPAPGRAMVWFPWTEGRSFRVGRGHAHGKVGLDGDRAVIELNDRVALCGLLGFLLNFVPVEVAIGLVLWPLFGPNRQVEESAQLADLHPQPWERTAAQRVFV